MIFCITALLRLNKIYNYIINHCVGNQALIIDLNKMAYFITPLKNSFAGMVCLSLILRGGGLNRTFTVHGRMQKLEHPYDNIKLPFF